MELQGAFRPNERAPASRTGGRRKERLRVGGGDAVCIAQENLVVVVDVDFPGEDAKTLVARRVGLARVDYPALETHRA